MTKDEMIGWHHQLSVHEFEPTSGDSEGQGSLVCCSWSCKELDMTERLNNSHFTLARMSIIKKTDKCWRGYGETGT